MILYQEGMQESCATVKSPKSGNWSLQMILVKTYQVSWEQDFPCKTVNFDESLLGLEEGPTQMKISSKMFKPLAWTQGASV